MREWRIVPPILGAEEIMVFLNCGRTKLDDFLRAGMPAIDLGDHPHAGRKGRTRRSLRFEPGNVIDWLRSRGNGGESA